LRSVAVTWQTTIEQLGELERRLLDLLAWFAPEPVPLSIFARLTELSQWDTDGFKHAISNLADFSMLTWDADLGTVKVHRVVQEILRTRQADPKANLNRALRLLQRSIPEGDPADVRTWPAWESLRLHVDSATQHGKRLDIPVPTSFLMGQLGTLLSARALHREAELLKRDALAIDELHFGPDSPEVAVRLNNLAQTLQDTNRLSEAEPLIRRALAIDEQSYGPDHPDVARDLNNLALLLKATNRLSEAEPLMRRALAIDEQSYGPDHPNVATALNNLALLLKATNRLSEAEPLMARVVTIFENSYGKEHPNVATALNNLALLLKATNRLSEAEPLMRRALAIDEQSYGPDHPDVARDLNNLAQLLKATNRLSEAEPLSWRMVSIFVGFGKATGHEHPQMQAALQNYFGILTDMGMSEQEAISKIQAKMRGGNP
ncbi:MAG: tetratricopeptide repeat protein, partial [Planctomycetota bacterium]